jgi:hypothetical protein
MVEVFPSCYFLHFPSSRLSGSLLHFWIRQKMKKWLLHIFFQLYCFSFFLCLVICLLATVFSFFSFASFFSVRRLSNADPMRIGIRKTAEKDNLVYKSVTTKAVKCNLKSGFGSDPNLNLELNPDPQHHSPDLHRNTGSDPFFLRINVWNWYRAIVT